MIRSQWASRAVRSTPTRSASWRSPVRIARGGSVGIDGVLTSPDVPSSRMRTKSVNVPPVSMPIRYPMLSLASEPLGRRPVDGQRLRNDDNLIFLRCCPNGYQDIQYVL